jgi:hypothetical protein
MPVKSATEKQLNKLASLLAVEPAPIPTGTRPTAFISKTLPDHLRPADEEWTGLSLVNDEASQYFQTLDLLEQEPELEHLDRDTIDASLWELACDLAVNWKKYSNTTERRSLVNEFLRKVTKPHESFEVMFVVEGLDIQGGALRIGTVRF